MRRPSALGPVLIVATLVELAFQFQWRPFNTGVGQYALPTSAASYEDRFADRYGGNVVQIASIDDMAPEERTADTGYADLTAGATYSIAGLETVSAYSGIGFVTHDEALCLRFDGAMCADAWPRLWQTPDGSSRPLADLLRAETVVVQNTLLDTTTQPAPLGWTLTESTPTAAVWRRIIPLEWPAGSLADVVGPIVIDDDTMIRAHREFVEFRRQADGPAVLTFARLAWPGYEATVDGRPLLVGGGPAGLLTVTVPPDLVEGTIELTWVPPYWRPSLAVLGLGVLVALGTQLAWWRRRTGEEPETG